MRVFHLFSFYPSITVHDVKLQLTLRKGKGNAECGKINIELNDLHVQDYSQSGSSNNATTRDPTGASATPTGTDGMTEEDELHELAQLINDNPPDLSSLSQPTGSNSNPSGTNSTAESSSRLHPNSAMGSNTPQSTPSISPQPTLPSSQQTDSTTTTSPNPDSWLLGAALANHVAQQPKPGNQSRSTPSQAPSNGPAATGTG